MDYSEIAPTYDRTRSLPQDIQEFWLPAVVLMADVRAGARVLDVGCGTGRLAVAMSDVYWVVGVDASRDMLEVARSKGSRAAFVQGDAGRLPFAGGSFDVSLAVMVLHLVRDFRASVRELARVARRAVIATIDMETRATHALDEAFPSLHGIDEARFPRIASIEEACRDAGFTGVETHRAQRRIESTAQEFLERVRGKYLSTLALLPPGEFERGLAWLEREFPRRGDGYGYDHTVTFAVASR